MCAVFLACFRDYRPHLAPGERATVLIIATDRRQARVIFRYIRALLTEVPMLARMIVREASESFDLSNSVSIEVGTASYRSIRGYTIVAALCDEMAFWPTDDSAQPDYEILDAIRPGMATIPGAMLLCASSPYARRGALWTAHRQHFGKEGSPILVWQADTRTMNPTVPKHVIAAANERDRQARRLSTAQSFAAMSKALCPKKRSRNALLSVCVSARRLAASATRRSSTQVVAAPIR